MPFYAVFKSANITKDYRLYNAVFSFFRSRNTCSFYQQLSRYSLQSVIAITSLRGTKQSVCRIDRISATIGANLELVVYLTLFYNFNIEHSLINIQTLYICNSQIIERSKIALLRISQLIATTMNKKIQLQDLGLKDYIATWEYQEELFKGVVDLKIKNRREETNLVTPNYFLFVEHPHVYTLGKSGAISNLLLSEKQLEAKGATFYKINRGGDITYHGPGQIVGYPILDLENFFTDIHKYLRFLEEVIILTLAEYNIIGVRSEGETGVWLGVGTPFARKICAMGVRASRWVTMHGFALNVNADLGYFDNIIPCGIKGKAVTSLNVELGVENVNEQEVKEKIVKHFAQIFNSVFEYPQ